MTADGKDPVALLVCRLANRFVTGIGLDDLNMDTGVNVGAGDGESCGDVNDDADCGGPDCDSRLLLGVVV